jgi:hypothetical protein
LKADGIGTVDGYAEQVKKHKDFRVIQVLERNTQCPLFLVLLLGVRVLQRLRKLERMCAT